MNLFLLPLLRTAAHQSFTSDTGGISSLWYTTIAREALRREWFALGTPIGRLSVNKEPTFSLIHSYNEGLVTKISLSL